jgi:hypothetical protein
VLLYELLTGKTPFDAKELLAIGLEEMRHAILEKEPMRPSTRLSTMLEGELATTAKERQADAPRLISLLRGDLDWIVMKALEKDRARRYDTASGLAMDVKRFLGNEPVLARPPSAVYRLQKVFRRNKLAFTAASAVAAALIIGLGLSTWLYMKEKEARQQTVAAELEQERLRAVISHISEEQQAKLRQESPQTLETIQYNDEVVKQQSAQSQPQSARKQNLTLTPLTVDDIKALDAAGVKKKAIIAEIGRSHSVYSQQDVDALQQADPNIDRAVIECMKGTKSN